MRITRAILTNPMRPINVRSKQESAKSDTMPRSVPKPDSGPLNIGENVRQLRKAQGMTLSRLAELANVSKSNLSKIENNVISPTFDMIEKISTGLGITTSELLSQGVPATDMLSFASSGEGLRSSNGSYEFEFLFPDLKNRKMIPIVTTVLPKQTEMLSTPSSHGGEEFFHVMDGSVDFVSDGKILKRMNKGDSVYFSSGVQHLVVNRHDTPSRLLWVWLA